MELEIEMKIKGLSDLIRLAGMVLVAAAVIQELRKPSSEREWRGNVFGIPYTFRPPTMDQVLDAYWAPEDPRIFKATPFGVGWAVNIAGVARQAQERGFGRESLPGR
jgi:hypothetical protein